MLAKQFNLFSQSEENNKEEQKDALTPHTEGALEGKENALDEEPVDVAFASCFTQKGGKFMYCETKKELVEQFAALLADAGFKSVFCWEPKLQNLFEDLGLAEDIIENQVEYRADVALSFCSKLVAENGGLLLNKEQATRRTLHVFPKVHVVVADVRQLCKDMPTAMAKIDNDVLPFLFQLDSSKPFITKDNRIVLPAQGPKDVFLFLCEEPLLL